MVICQTLRTAGRATSRQTWAPKTTTVWIRIKHWIWYTITQSIYYFVLTHCPSLSKAMDDEPIDATVGVGIGGVPHNTTTMANNISRMEKNPITANGSALPSKFGSNRNPSKFPSNDRNGSGNGTSLQPPAPQLSPTTFATAAAALATAAAANGISVNQLLTQVSEAHPYSNYKCISWLIK